MAPPVAGRNINHPYIEQLMREFDAQTECELTLEPKAQSWVISCGCSFGNRARIVEQIERRGVCPRGHGHVANWVVENRYANALFQMNTDTIHRLGRALFERDIVRGAHRRLERRDITNQNTIDQMNAAIQVMTRNYQGFIDATEQRFRLQDERIRLQEESNQLQREHNQLQEQRFQAQQEHNRLLREAFDAQTVLSKESADRTDQNSHTDSSTSSPKVYTRDDFLAEPSSRMEDFKLGSRLIGRSVNPFSDHY